MEGEGSTASNSIGECSHCSDVSVEPLKMNCGHTICGACLRWWFTSPGPGTNQPCPVCRVLKRYKSLKFRIYGETSKSGDPIHEDSESHYEGRPIPPAVPRAFEQIAEPPCLPRSGAARDSHEEHSIPVRPHCSSGRLLPSRSERVPLLAPFPDRNQGVGSEVRIRVGSDNVASRELTPTVLTTAQLRDLIQSRLRARGILCSRSSPPSCVQVPDSRPLRQRTRTYRATASHASRCSDNLQRPDFQIRRVAAAENALSQEQPVDIQQQSSIANHSARDLTSVELLRRSVSLVIRLQAELDVKVAELLMISAAALENSDIAFESASGS